MSPSPPVWGSQITESISQSRLCPDKVARQVEQQVDTIAEVPHEQCEVTKIPREKQRCTMLPTPPPCHSSNDRSVVIGCEVRAFWTPTTETRWAGPVSWPVRAWGAGWN